MPGAREADLSEVAPPSGRFLAKATLVTAALTAAAALLGLGRDQALSYLFGAGSETDAFLGQVLARLHAHGVAAHFKIAHGHRSVMVGATCGTVRERGCL